MTRVLTVPAHEAPDTDADLADTAVRASVDEAVATPKPGLVDRRGNGAHSDMDLALLCASAHALRPGFQQVAAVARGRDISVSLREEIGHVGRLAERDMLEVTGGVNTHRGAIWALGLLVAARAATSNGDPVELGRTAGKLALLPDRTAPQEHSHGNEVARRFGVGGARAEASEGFPHALAALDALRASRTSADGSVRGGQVSALLTSMSTLDDTCLLHRGGMRALRIVQRQAASALRCGGMSTAQGRRRVSRMDQYLRSRRLSPGGSADVLAAALMLDELDRTRESSWKH